MSPLEDVGIVVALQAEHATLRTLRSARIEVSGPGPDNAGKAASRLLSRGVRQLVSWGTAGGLVPHLPAGTLLISSRAINAAPALADTSDTLFEEALAQACATLEPVRGIICSVPKPVCGRAGKEALNTSTGALLVDMESAAVAAVARQAGLPFAAVRAIVDPLEFEIPFAAMAGMRADGSSSVWPVLASLVRGPHQLISLCRLGLHFRAALKKLEATAVLLHQTGFPRSGASS